MRRAGRARDHDDVVGVPQSGHLNFRQRRPVVRGLDDHVKLQGRSTGRPAIHRQRGTSVGAGGRLSVVELLSRQRVRGLATHHEGRNKKGEKASSRQEHGIDLAESGCPARAILLSAVEVFCFLAAAKVAACCRAPFVPRGGYALTFVRRASKLALLALLAGCGGKLDLVAM